MNRQSLDRQVGWKHTETLERIADQLREQEESKPKRNKYGAKKTTLDGHTFDSLAERDYYLLLLSKQQRGEIEAFRCQPEYILQEKYRNADGKARAAIKYTADFEVTHPDGTVDVVDVKGKASRDFSLRLRLFEKRYGMALKVVNPKDIPHMR